MTNPRASITFIIASLPITLIACGDQDVDNPEQSIQSIEQTPGEDAGDDGDEGQDFQHGGLPGVEMPGDEVDEPAEDVPDADGDGYDSVEFGGDDCDDTDAALNHDDLDDDGLSTCAGDCDDDDSERAWSCTVSTHVAYDAGRSGHNPDESVIDADNVSGLGSAWRYPTSSAVLATPVVSDGLVYVGTAFQGVYAVDAYDGTLAWWAETGGVAEGGVAIAEGVAYVPSRFREVLYAFDAETGQALWEAGLGGRSDSAPVVANDIVYHGTTDGYLHALDARNGSTVWSLELGGEVGSPAVVDGLIHVSAGGDIVTVSTDKGTEVWSAEIGHEGVMPAAVDGVVYAGADDGVVYGFDTGTGRIVFEAETDAGAAYSPTVAQGIVYTSADDGQVYAFETTGGDLLWVVPVSSMVAAGASVADKPSVANGVLYAADRSGPRSVYAFDARTGVPLWQQGISKTTEASSGSPVISDGMLFVAGTAEYGVYAFEL